MLTKGDSTQPSGQPLACGKRAIPFFYSPSFVASISSSFFAKNISSLLFSVSTSRSHFTSCASSPVEKNLGPLVVADPSCCTTDYIESLKALTKLEQPPAMPVSRPEFRIMEATTLLGNSSRQVSVVLSFQYQPPECP